MMDSPIAEPSSSSRTATAPGEAPLSPSRPLLRTSSSNPSSPLSPSTSTSFHNASSPIHPGCVLCGLVASAASQSSRDSMEMESMATGSRPRRGVKVGEREIIHQDAEITVYPATGKERLCSEGRHLVLVLNQHVESVYSLGASDIPLLSHILNTAEQILGALPSSSGDTERAKRQAMRVGFVGPLMRDPQSPHAHLHAHAMLGPVDTSLPGAGMWRRNVVFGSMNWWSIEDLRAEIRESTSNNRVKSGYADRQKAPIERVPDAGSVSGPPNIVLSPATSGTGTPQSHPNSHSALQSVTSSPRSRPSDVLLHDQNQQATASATSRGKRRAEPEPTREDDLYEAVDLGDMAKS